MGWDEMRWWDLFFEYLDKLKVKKEFGLRDRFYLFYYNFTLSNIVDNKDEQICF